MWYHRPSHRGTGRSNNAGLWVTLGICKKTMAWPEHVGWARPFIYILLSRKGVVLPKETLPLRSWLFRGVSVHLGAGETAESPCPPREGLGSSDRSATSAGAGSYSQAHGGSACLRGQPLTKTPNTEAHLSLPSWQSRPRAIPCDGWEDKHEGVGKL